MPSLTIIVSLLELYVQRYSTGQVINFGFMSLNLSHFIRYVNSF